MSGARTVADLTADEVARFWSKVAQGAPESCWLWTKRTNSKGYGRFDTWHGGRRQRFLAHRVAFQLASREPLDGLLLLHSCDTPACCNPSHLRPGTQAENMADAWAKGRMVPPPLHRGEDAPSARLTAVQVEEIRCRYARGGISQRALGAEYGVTQTAIGHIVRGTSWRTS
ncbi:hypothetical protein ACIGCZ_37035 [Streptomyces nigra]|uniref:hypothetical protein n=1 Tax=Streptomyces nigra TaxID=1827580 RepID=UPI0037CD1E27